MTLTELDKDIQTMTYNEGQIQLVRNIISTNYESLEELIIMLRAWSDKLQKETDKVNKKYEGLKK
tara:strand:- start:440 stop:634 length:195 start_codon:yes stop_codon:yes gene_type:complete